MNDEELNKITFAGNAEEVMRLGCPQCGGPLNISFHGGERSALNLCCDGMVLRTCFYSSHSDGRNFPSPPWVERLGPQIKTVPKGEGL